MAQQDYQPTPSGIEREDTLIGPSESFQRVLTLIDTVANRDCAVLMEGESGTGKELLARRLHANSSRSAEPFIPVNCPAVAESLFESQFYGHVKGSFTGAGQNTLGMVRAADGGTLFLDEIGELPMHLQPKLLRLLQEKEVTPVGGTEAVRVDVRFVAATNRSLARAVSAGRFRRDLYHRLNVVRIQIPPLRQRRDDIEPLIEFYLERFAEEYGLPPRELDKEIRRRLLDYAWPGNIRELCCWVERLYAMDLPALPPGNEAWDDQYGIYIDEDAPPGLPGDMPFAEPGVPLPDAAARSSSGDLLRQAEIDAIRTALHRTRGNRSQAARLLNIHRTTLLRKLRQYDIA